MADPFELTRPLQPRPDEDGSDSDDNQHRGHGLSGEPISLGHYSSEHRSATSNGRYNTLSDSEEVSVPIPKKKKKKKWTKRFQLASLRKFQSRKARKARQERYPSITLNDADANRAKDFYDNLIITSKYTALSFVPKVLFEQFRKVTSVYFLLITILTAIPVISPISPWTSILGLLFIIVVAGIREGYEDFLRHKADRVVNQREYTVIGPAGNLMEVRSENLRVGDWILLRKNQETPADCVLISSSDPQGSAFVQTAQLDGETNLKLLNAPALTGGVTTSTVGSLRGTLDCELPHHNLYEFRANLNFALPDGSTQTVPLQTSSLMLRGTFLKNTDSVIAIVAYTGLETKLSLNSTDPPSKMSTLDKRLNVYVLGILAAMTVLSVVLGFFAGIFEGTEVDDMWYLDPDGQNAVTVGIISAFSYFILLSYMIPLSLIVSLEIIKVVQTKWMEWDLLMLGPDGRTMTAKTSDLNDELALVRYIFSDKTGTLTENLMEFNRCAVRDQVFLNPMGGELFSYVQSGAALAQDVRLFLTAMSICHNVVVSEGSDEFQAASPDEEALCTAAKANRFVFIGREGATSCNIRINNEPPIPFEILCEFPFTSARRRMSILVRSPALQGGTVAYLFSKGADAEILARLRPSSPSLDESEARIQAEANLAAFSREGYRTLAYACRVLSVDETTSFLRGYHDAASTGGDDRDQAVEAFANEWERNLTLLGVTGIEDRLQAHVPETLEFLQAANINVWMITGDKQETAINIGYSCRLLKPDMDVLELNAASGAECADRLAALIQRGSTSDQRQALVVDGQTLAYIFDTGCDGAFLDLAVNCQSVIVCRATPMQKANVVKLVRERVGVCCLAIGDGANDVSMIQEANVGIGLFGREGSLAARSSDYALHRFAHLQRLLIVHGRYSLIRNAFVVHYSFYKNAAVFLSQVWFAFYCGFSAQSLYDDWLMTLYNIMITSVPPLIVGVFEKDCPEALLIRHPKLYLRTQSDTLFTLRTLGLWMLAATWHSLILGFGTFSIWDNSDILKSNGQTLDLTALGNTCLAVSVVVVFLKAALEIQFWPWIVHVGMWASLLIFFAIFAVESELVHFVPAQFNQFATVLGSSQFWFWLFLAIVFCLLPDFLLKATQKIFFPEEWEVLREQYLLTKHDGSSSFDNHDAFLKQSPPFTTYPQKQEISHSSSTYSLYGDQPMSAPLLRDEEE